jgi:hypothetical protein
MTGERWTPRKWGHDELLLDLAQHLQRPERMLWMDMQMGKSGSPRPDVYTMDKSYVKPRPISYEVKVSVSDFRSDITTGKWQNYLGFSSAVVFCVPAGLITKNELPGGCGLMVRGDEGWRTLKAPTLQAVTLKQEHLLKLLIDGIERASAAHRVRDFNIYSANQKIKRELGETVALAVQDAENLVNHAKHEASAITARAESAAKSAERRADDAEQRIEKFKDAREKVLGELCELLGLDIRYVHEDRIIWAAKEFKEKQLADERLVVGRRVCERAMAEIRSCLSALGGRAE